MEVDEENKVLKYRTLLKLEEVAERLGLSVLAVRVLILYDRKIPHIRTSKIFGYRVRLSDLEAYISKQEQEMAKE